MTNSVPSAFSVREKKEKEYLTESTEYTEKN